MAATQGPLACLRQVREEIFREDEAHARRKAKLYAERAEAIQQANFDHSHRKIAIAAGISPTRVAQIIHARELVTVRPKQGE